MLTVYGEPDKHSAGFEATGDFVNPLIIESHPTGQCLAPEVTWLGVVPEIWCSGVLVPAVRVPRKAALHSQAPYPHSSAQYGTGGRRSDVAVATNKENDRAEEEKDSRESKR